jgi:hypothetical protein
LLPRYVISFSFFLSSLRFPIFLSSLSSFFPPLSYLVTTFRTFLLFLSLFSTFSDLPFFSFFILSSSFSPCYHVSYCLSFFLWQTTSFR